MSLPPDKSCRPPEWRGLTLMEVVIAMLLMATLLAGLWSLLHIVSRLFGRGRQVAVEAGLVRSLVDQIQTDLQSVIPPVGRTDIDTGLVEAGSRGRRRGFNNVRPRLASGVAGSLPHFGLIGDSRSLYLSVLQAARPALEEQLAAEGSNGDDQLVLESLSQLPTDDLSDTGAGVSEEGGGQRAAFAPELRMVAYTFRSPLEQDAFDEDASGEQPPPGLTRRDVPWEMAPDLVQVSQTAGWLTPTVASGFNEYSVIAHSAAIGDSGAEGGGSDAFFDVSQFGTRDITVVPEVVDLQFRYFDGQSWQSSWDSFQMRKLPEAVEVTFRVLTQAELKEARQLLGLDAEAESPVESTDDTGTLPTGAPDEPNSLDSGLTGVEGEAQPELPAGRTYRAVIYLPAGAQEEATRSEQPTTNDAFDFNAPAF